MERKTEFDLGTMAKAMALKVKYRRCFDCGHKYKKRIMWDLIGVHPENRGTLFPQIDTLKLLGKNIMAMGASIEEADHMGVVVEEEPQSRSFSEWNAEKVKEDSELQPCFPPHLCLQFAFLSHTHLVLVLKAFIGSAPWDIGPLPLNNKTQLTLCDSEGNLSFE